MKMISDLKIEIFAYNIFQTAFLSHRLIQNKSSIFEIYEDERIADPSYGEACDDLFHKAIFCRRQLFQIIYKGELMYEKIESCKSSSDLFDYLINLCDQDYLFHKLNVFERMFATCAFVVSMCVHIYWYNVVDVISNGHIFWAIFFDKYTEEFYKEGGWKKLKQVAKTYDLLYEFLALFPENFDNYLGAIKEATINYRYFKEFARSKGTKPVTKMWVRFHIKNIANYVRIPANYEISLNPMKIEILLDELKQFCDPRCFNEFVSRTHDSDIDDISLERHRVKRISEFLSTTEDSCSSKDGSDSDNSMKRCQGLASETFKTCSVITAGDVDLQISSLPLAYKKRIADPFNGKLSNISIEYNKQLQKKHSVLNLEANAIDHLHKKGNREHEEKIIDEKELLPTNTSELDQDVCSQYLYEHNILVVETMSQPFEPSTEKSPNNENLDFDHNLQYYGRSPDNEDEMGTTNIIHSINSTRRELEEKIINETKDTSELDPNVCSLKKHNISVVETMNQPFEPSTEKSPNNENLDFGHSAANYDRNPDNESELDTTNNIHSIKATRKSEITNAGKDVFANNSVESLLEAKSPLKILRTQKQFNIINEHTHIDDGRKNKKTVEDYFDSRKREINETVKPINVFTKLKAAVLDIAHNLEGADIVSEYVNSGHEKEESIIKTDKFLFDLITREMNDIDNPIVARQCHRKISSNIARYTKDFNLTNATVNSGGEREIIQRKVDELRKEQDDTQTNQFLRTLLMLEGRGAIEYMEATLEMPENSSESLKNPNKRSVNEEESTRKKFSPERKELGNEISDTRK